MSETNSNQGCKCNSDCAEQAERALREQKWSALEAVAVTSHTWNGAFAALANMVLNARKAGATWAEIAESAFMTEAEAEQLFSKVMWHIVIGEAGIKVLGHIAYRKDITLSEALSWVIDKVLEKKPEPDTAANNEAPDSESLDGDAADTENESGKQPKYEPVLGHRDGLLSMPAPEKSVADGSTHADSEPEYYTSDEVNQIISEVDSDRAKTA